MKRGTGRAFRSGCNGFGNRITAVLSIVLFCVMRADDLCFGRLTRNRVNEERKRFGSFFMKKWVRENMM